MSLSNEIHEIASCLRDFRGPFVSANGPYSEQVEFLSDLMRRLWSIQYRVRLLEEATVLPGEEPVQRRPQ